MSARTLAESVGREAGSMEYNRRILGTIADAKLPMVRDVLGPQETQNIIVKAQMDAQLSGLSPQETARHVGEALTDALAEKGHSPLVGDLQRPMPGDFDMGADIAHEQVREDTPVVLQGVKNKLAVGSRPSNTSAIGRGFDKANSFYSRNRLPFSLRHYAQAATGGLGMAWGGGGVGPGELISKMAELKNLDPVANEQVFHHPDFAEGMLTQGERDIMRPGQPGSEPTTALGKAIGKYKQWSFNATNALHAASRHAYTLAKLDRTLGEQGLSVDKLGGDEAAWKKPEVQQAITSAVKDATKVMGSFDDMSPFEQRVAKRAFPYFAWTRHITALALRTAVDNPARMMWMARVGSYGSDPTDPDRPGWVKSLNDSGVPIPGTGMSVSLNSLNPFADVAGMLTTSPAKTLGGMSSPVIDLGAAGLVGADADKGFGQFTRPYGSGTKGITPLMTRPLELGQQVINQFPIAQAAEDMLPTHTFTGSQWPYDGTVSTGPVVRYGAGEPIRKFGTVPRVRRLLPLSGFYTTPTKKG